MDVAAEDVDAGDVGQFGACRTSRWRTPAAVGRSVSGWPSRSTSTVHSRVASDQVALVAAVLDQYGTSITLV